MRLRQRRIAVITVVMLCVVASALGAAVASSPGAGAAPAKPEHLSAPPPERRPDEFAFVFTLGYGDDLLPQDEAQFDAVMEKVAAGGFNVVLASYEDWRIPILRKHGLKLMVNMLDSRHHVYKNVEESERLARSLRGNDAIWGYHLFSDTVSSIVAGRQRDVANLHEWDPTHPTFVGFKHHVGSQIWELQDPDVAAYYDYHWVRDRSIHFSNLARLAQYAEDRGAALYRWTWVENGKAGIGNPNRSRYTVSTSMAFGLVGAVWFIGQDMMSTSTWEWNQFGLDTISVNHDLAPVGAELVGLQRLATYSTETMRTANDKEKGVDDPPIPAPLEAFPDDHWLRASSGEVVIGEFKGQYPGEWRLLVANHNAYQPQPVVLELDGPVYRVQLLDRETGVWRELPVEDGAISWQLGPGYADLVRVTRYADAPTVTSTPGSSPGPTATTTSEPSPPATPSPDLPLRILLPYAGAVSYRFASPSQSPGPTWSTSLSKPSPLGRKIAASAS